MEPGATALLLLVVMVKPGKVRRLGPAHHGKQGADRHLD